MGLVDTLIAQFQQQQASANAANEQRFQQGLDIFDRIIKQQETGDVSEKAIEAAISRGSTKAVAQGTQSLVSSGLSSTTQAAGLGKKFEEEVGMPARLQAADIRQQRLNQSLRDKAGFIERREDIGPSYSDIAGLAQSIGRGSAARTQPRAASNPYAGLARLQAEGRARKASQQITHDARLARLNAPRPSTQRTSTGLSAATVSRRRTAQSYAQLTSQRQQAGNRARAAAGL